MRSSLNIDVIQDESMRSSLNIEVIKDRIDEV